jgi:hypothetical protein
VGQKLAFLVGGLAVGALVAGLLRRRLRPAGPAPCAPDPRAEALRHQLAASRADLPAPSGEAGTAEPKADVDESRRRVHDEGRAALRDMRLSAKEGEGEGEEAAR